MICPMCDGLKFYYVDDHGKRYRESCVWCEGTGRCSTEKGAAFDELVVQEHIPLTRTKRT